MWRPIGRFLACAGLLLIAATTLVPIPQQTAASQLTPLWCLVCGDYGGVDVVNNIILFVPAALGSAAGLELDPSQAEQPRQRSLRDVNILDAVERDRAMGAADEAAVDADFGFADPELEPPPIDEHGNGQADEHDNATKDGDLRAARHRQIADCCVTAG